MIALFDDLKRRGFVYQLSDEDTIPQRLEAKNFRFYLGIDPTADSLHVGHLLPIMAARFLQAKGHTPIIVIGGGTAMVGDPSEKAAMRKMMPEEKISFNSQALQQQIKHFIDPTTSYYLNNIDWLKDCTYLEFLRDIGAHFSINRMLTTESVKTRLEKGSLSFLEFNYSLLQAYDFYVLARDYACELQIGGQDQWGNIVAGIDLIRRLLRQPAYGLTVPLLTDSEGQKFGKSVAGAIWLDTKKTSVFDYYQFWRNTKDTDVEKLLAYFTDLPVDEIRHLASLKDPEINRAKEVLAYEVTSVTHGSSAAAKAYQDAGRIFGFADPEGKIETSSDIKKVDVDFASYTTTMERVALDRQALIQGIWLVKLMVDLGLAKSNSEARRFIQAGAVKMNGEKIDDVGMELTPTNFDNGPLLLHRGRKNVRMLVLSS